jgi:hypothetical protein
MTDFRADDWQPKPYGVAQRLREARTPNAADIRAWAELTSMSDEKRDEALATLEQFRASERSWKDRMKLGRQKVQIEYLRLYRDTTHFRIFQNCWVPGILQTADYARQIFTDLNDLDPDTPHDVEADVQKRMQRRDYLNDLGKTFEVVITESVIRDLIVDAPVMRSQMQRLIDLADLPNVKFGILPQGRRRHTAAQGNFVVFGDDFAVTEDFIIDTPIHGKSVDRLKAVMARFWAEAVADDEALEVIRSARDALPRS